MPDMVGAAHLTVRALQYGKYCSKFVRSEVMRN